MIAMDYARYLAPIDLHFTQPAEPIKGIPLGNGKMGTLVWIDGPGSKLQFNFGRSDVFYRGSATATWHNKSHTDGNSKVGQIFIEVTSQRGGPCTLRNYWGRQSVDLYRNQIRSGTLSAAVFAFETKAGENIVLVKTGTNPESFRVKLPSAKGANAEQLSDNER